MNMRAGSEADTERLRFIACALLVEPGSRELGLLVGREGAGVALARLIEGEVSPSLAGAVATRLTAEGHPRTVAGALGWAARSLERTERLGARIVVPGDDEWPAQFSDLVRISRSDGTLVDRDVFPPLCLWARGPLPLHQTMERSVAIVGARAASEYGRHVAGELGYGLVDRAWSVVSGGAFGIDAAAHRAALAGGGSTVAVLACGIDRPYPASNTSLFERVAAEGLLITEWPPEAAPFRQRFLVRNRVIAAATRGTVVVEAAARSGARQTLARARALGRAAMVVPGPVTSAMSVGCHAELRGLCETRLVTSTEEIIEEVGSMGEFASAPSAVERPYDTLDPLAARVLDAVPARAAMPAEEIAARAGVSGGKARAALPVLVAAGLVEVSGTGGYRLVFARGATGAKRGAGAPPSGQDAAVTHPDRRGRDRAGGPRPACP